MKRSLSVGTRSLLFGVHQFWLHPVMVALAWWRLYGFPRDLRVWCSFLLHDLGYWGKTDMDGPSGETHVELGAAIMGMLFGDAWEEFTLLHSRSYAQQLGLPPSRLCMADKYSFVLECPRFYLWRARLSGELDEYLARRTTPGGKYAVMGPLALEDTGQVDLDAWQRELAVFLERYVRHNAHLATPEPGGRQ